MKDASTIRILLTSSAMCLCLSATKSYALPAGADVAAGVADVQTAGAHTVVFQASDRAVVDWKSFDVQANEQVHFSQPSAHAAILNRIHDTDASRIDGTLTANGQVFISSPNGVIFGNGAKVDVGSLVATTATIADDAFMAGGTMEFSSPGAPAASIENHGSITVREGGLAALVAPQVSNTGHIVAKAGKVVLAAGDTMTLDFYGDGLLSVSASSAVMHQSIHNAGLIEAQQGTVLLTTAQAASVIDSAINMSGMIDASSATDEGGTIVFAGADANINVQAGAILNATGATDGGTVRIGGEYQGGGITPTAHNTSIASGATIDVSATRSGAGGEAIVWADDITVFAGTIRATGHSKGGFVETSGKHKLYASGNVEASASSGQAGQWLLDPTNVTVANGAGTNVSAGGTFSGAAAIDANTLQTALNNGTSVTISTTSGGGNPGNITLDNVTINKNNGGNASLTLKAENSILTNGTNSISSTSGALDIILWANSDDAGSGAIDLINTSFSTFGGKFIAGGGLDSGANGGIAGDNIPDEFAKGNITNTSAISLDNSTITTAGGNVIMRGTNRINGIIMNNASKISSADGSISLTGTGGTGAGIQSIGVYIGGEALVTSASGAITIVGDGGATTNNYDSGIVVEDGGRVTSTGIGAGVGAVSLTGTAHSTGLGEYGILIENTTAFTTGVTSVDADIILRGTSNAGTGNYHAGVFLGEQNASPVTVATTGTGAHAGNISITGNGGAGAQFNGGIWIGYSDTSVTTKDGNITLNATGGNGTNDYNHGMYLYNGASVSTTAGGNITIAAQGGNGAAGNSHGLVLETEGTKITTTSGNITVSGTGGNSGANNHGVLLFTGPDILVNGSGNTTITATAGAAGTDFVTSGGVISVGGGAAQGNLSLSMQNYSFANATFSTTGSGNITLKPRDVTSGIGVSGGGGAFQVTDALIALMTPGSKLVIGDSVSGSGAIDVDEWNMGALGYGVALHGGTIDVNNSIGNFNITGTYQGTSGQLNAGTGTISATTGFSSLNILGAGATLSAGYIGAAGDPLNQNMANKISISGIAYPTLIANPSYTFAGYVIGAANTNFSSPTISPTVAVTPSIYNAEIPATGGETTIPPSATGGSITSGGSASLPPFLPGRAMPEALTPAAITHSQWEQEAASPPALDSSSENVDVQYYLGKSIKKYAYVKQLYSIDPHLRAWLNSH